MTAGQETRSVEGRDLLKPLVEGAGAVEDQRPMRADALRNRTRILEAAEKVFASEGISVPIDVVAERAGVGAGTLYRHFPTKEALLEAIITNRLAQLAELAESYMSAADPGEALFSYLREFAEHAATKRDLFDAIVSAGIEVSVNAEIDELMKSIDRLRLRAAEQGAIRPDVTGEDLASLIVGVCSTKGKVPYDPGRVDRCLAVVCEGLRPPRVASSSLTDSE